MPLLFSFFFFHFDFAVPAICNMQYNFNLELLNFVSAIKNIALKFFTSSIRILSISFFFFFK